MKTIATTLVLFFSALCLKADSLWVHHIGVGQGDATLIVAWQQRPFPGGVDTTSILIDAGNSSGKGNAVFAYVNDVLGSIKHINFVITSHLHSDHIGGMPALLKLMLENKWKVDRVVDRGFNFSPKADSCYSDEGHIDNDTVQPVDLPNSQIYKNYQSVVSFYDRSNMRAGVDLFRYLNRPANMSMVCVAANACVLQTYGSSGIKCAANQNLDENDYSFAFLLSFEGYKYFTGGDIGGAPPYLNMETPMVNYFETWPIMDFHFCTYKASHHGSPHSSNRGFVQFNLPTLTVIPSALRSFNGTQLPGKSTLDLLTEFDSKLAYTYNYTSQPYSGTVDAFIDVKIRINNPGYDEDIPMPIYRRLRSKTSPYLPVGVFTYWKTVTCYKYHDQLPSGMVAETVTPDTAFSPNSEIKPVKQGIRSAELPARKARKIKRLKRKARQLNNKAMQLLQQ